MSGVIKPVQIVQLYRNLLRYGKNLKLTDKNFYFQRVRTEFRNNKTQTSPEHIEFLYKKGKSLLERNRLR